MPLCQRYLSLHVVNLWVASVFFVHLCRHFLQDANCGNTLLLSLDLLVEDGLLSPSDLPPPQCGSPFSCYNLLPSTLSFCVSFCHPSKMFICILHLRPQLTFVPPVAPVLHRPVERIDYVKVAELKDAPVAKVMAQDLWHSSMLEAH